MLEPIKNRVKVNIEDEMRQSYLSYSMSVIVGRALPDVRDGLKPVHRRILYAMFREGLLHNKSYSKCAGIVGEVLKKFHPHGDSAVYDTMVRMAQTWNMRSPLIDGQGNFGSVDGDPAAAYRYTEARMTHLAEKMLVDIDKETVDFEPNFDNTTAEPLCLPTLYPNLLVNGSDGIAVGMATKIPPHNLGEVTKAVVAQIKNPQVTVPELIELMPGPDFPTGGFIMGREAIRSAYETGRGVIRLRARASIETHPRTKRESIIVTEIPFQVNKARLIERIAELVRHKKVDGISDLRDESDRDGMRIAIELKKDAVPIVVLNRLYKMTALEDSFGVIMIALDNNQPKVMGLKEVIAHFIEHRQQVIYRRTVFDLKRAKEREHILEGFKIAIDNLDAVIKLIRGSANRNEAREGLIEKFDLSELQANAILDMRLHQLTSLEIDKVINELNEVRAMIKELQSILASEEKIKGIIIDELEEVADKFADKRRTEIIDTVEEISLEDMIAVEEMVVTVSRAGYVKRTPVTQYRAQRRGGRGKAGMSTRDEDFVSDLFVASTHSYILFFSTKGKVYWIKVHELPEAGRAARGKMIVNMLPLEQGEKIAAFLTVRQFVPGRFVVLATEKGIVKKTDLMAYANPRTNGIIAITIDDDDKLIAARMTTGEDHIIFSTRYGMAIRFSEDQARPLGRTARGVKGISLREGDQVVSFDVISEGTSILSVTQNGFGKRTALEDYRAQNRGGIGLITIKTNERNGHVIDALPVHDEDDFFLITNAGTIIRQKSRDVRVIGRNTQGVKLINLGEGEKVVDVARVQEKEEEDLDELGELDDLAPNEYLENEEALEPEEDSESTTGEDNEEE